MFGRLLDLLYPRECELCGRALSGTALEALCADCDDRIEWIRGRACRLCGAGVPTAAAEVRRCGECRGREMAFKAAVAAGRYSGLVRDLVHRFKFRGAMHLARPFATKIAERLRESGWADAIDVIVPVPTTTLRVLERRYSASEVLAIRLSMEVRKPWTKGLRIARTVPSQTELTGAERLRNPAGAFAGAPKRVRGRHVLLVDDVLTTGATASECTRALRDAGAEQVYVAVVGR